MIPCPVAHPQIGHAREYPLLPPGEKVPLMGGASLQSSSQGGRRPMLHPTPTPPNIELLRYISCYLPRFIYFPLKYNLNTSFVRITRHFSYRQLLKHVAFHDRRARRGLRLRDETMASRPCGSKNKALKNISIHFCYLLQLSKSLTFTHRCGG